MRRRIVLVCLLATALPLAAAAAAGGGARLLLRVPPADSAVGNSDLAYFAADGTQLENLTAATHGRWAYEQDPAFSPDGARIAWSSHRDGSMAQEIYVMNADGTSQTRLTFDSGSGRIGNTHPAWSPDGRRLAWLKLTAPTSAAVWLMDADGSNQHPLTQPAPLDTFAGIVWQPRGSLLAYEASDGNVHVVDAASGADRVLTKADLDTIPTWTPDGRELVWASGGELAYASAADGSVRTVDVGVRALGAVSFSPDGKSIAFTGQRSWPEIYNRNGTTTGTDVYVADADGSHARRIGGALGTGYDPLAAEDAPSWWPDGSRLFVRHAAGLWTIDADGTCATPFGGRRAYQQPVWQPGGTTPPPPPRCTDVAVYGSLGNQTEYGRSEVGRGRAAAAMLAIENRGNEPATGLRLTLSAARGTVRVPGVACTGTQPSLVCTLPTLPPQHAATVRVEVASRVAGLDGLKVTAAASGVDSDPGDNASSVSWTVFRCHRIGSWADDVFRGGPENDSYCGLPGRDTISGGPGDDLLDGGSGRDVIVGGPGHDTIDGGDSSDVIRADDGERDVVDCGAQRDTVYADRIDVLRNCEVVHYVQPAARRSR